MRILIQLAHPAFHRSKVNARLIAAVDGLADVTINNLYDAYPDFQIDTERERELLEAHDVIVLHHPIYWYSSPAIVKEWQDLVLEFGYAYGPAGTALKGKFLLNALTTGSAADAYSATGVHQRSLLEFLHPFRQTAHLCHMTYLPPFVVFQGRGLGAQDLAEAARNYRRTLEALATGRLKPEQALKFDFLNQAAPAPATMDGR
jgi:glutathione-regulated potassium-efflux system ancillary protein KefG